MIKKKAFKSIVSTFMSVCMVFAISGGVFADNFEDTVSGSYVIASGNVYLEALEGANTLQEKEEVHQEYVQKVFELQEGATLDSLIDIGCTREQAELILEFDGTQDITSIFGFEITCDQNLVSYTYSNGKTKADIDFSFSRSGVAWHTYRDMILLGWSEGFYCTDTSDMSLTVTYKSTRNDGKYSVPATDNRNSNVYKTTLGVGTSGAAFEMDKKIGTRMLVYSGAGSIHLEKSGRVPEFSFLVSYIESQKNISNPSLSVGISVSGGNIGGDASISVSLVDDMEELDHSLEYYEL